MTVVDAIPTPALAFPKSSSSALTTFSTPPYDRNDAALIQYSYCLSVESGFPKFLINSSSFDT